jgi:hypothetical protein
MLLCSAKQKSHRKTDGFQNLLFLNLSATDEQVGTTCDRKVAPSLSAVLLNARGAKTSEAMLFDGALPAEIFFNGERVARAGVFEAQKAPANCRYYLCLAADNPPM